MRTTGFSVIDIFMIGAAAGMVIGVLNISGLGFGLTLSLVQIAGGNLIVLLVLAAIVSIILGMGMPTVGVYILLATLVAPALIEMKIDPIAAHLFIMYFGMMSMITPPVCVGAFAAAIDRRSRRRCAPATPPCASAGPPSSSRSCSCSPARCCSRATRCTSPSTLPRRSPASGRYRRR